MGPDLEVHYVTSDRLRNDVRETVIHTFDHSERRILTNSTWTYSGDSRTYLTAVAAMCHRQYVVCVPSITVSK
ncbi:hypothetical protein SCLCIDRAFT_862858 [Scleroderma citrinum Foug A]|uniref:Uncharacterized protein n=1 Tax=Scleroderma citrinum Foug A TaxID=1036808 RepID=A0A0C3DZL5_9AGAM|nr:hypothetical protein SCLCIDRAFT_862858 [Scleroderma citrinum Foug A]